MLTHQGLKAIGQQILDWTLQCFFLYCFKDLLKWQTADWHDFHVGYIVTYTRYVHNKDGMFAFLVQCVYFISICWFFIIVSFIVAFSCLQCILVTFALPQILFTFLLIGWLFLMIQWASLELLTEWPFSDLSACSTGILSLLERLSLLYTRGQQHPLRTFNFLRESDWRKYFLLLQQPWNLYRYSGRAGGSWAPPYQLPSFAWRFWGGGCMVPSHSPHGRMLTSPIFCRSWGNNPLLCYWKQLWCHVQRQGSFYLTPFLLL